MIYAVFIMLIAIWFMILGIQLTLSKILEVLRER